MKKIQLLLIACLFASIANSQTMIQFAGITWQVKNGLQLGPGPNNWSNSPSSVWVDAEGSLHMKIRKSGNTWYCSEVIAQQSFGYGEYRFYLASDVESYDPEVVVGLFTYETDTREIDIEFSRWGNAGNADGYYTIQPVVPGNQQTFIPNLAGKNSTHKFIWSSHNIFFQSYFGHSASLASTDSLIKEWNYTGKDIPPVGNERLHINFWLFQGHTPVNQQEAELIIKSVSVPTNTASVDFPVSTGMKISPNPFMDKISVELPRIFDECSISVCNSEGKEILKKLLKQMKTEIDLGAFPSGIYFAKLIHNQDVEVQKIIKK